MATAHKLTNKNFSEWQVDQALAFAKESIDSRFCPGYAMKNPTLVGILMQMQMNLEMKLDDLDAQDLQNNDVKPVIPKDSETKYEMTLRILQDNFANSFFSAKQAYDAIRPYRWKSTVSKFKDEETFRGTILAELQLLKKKGFLSFVDGQGTYCLI